MGRTECIWEDFTKQVLFEQRLEGVKEMNHVESEGRMSQVEGWTSGKALLSSRNNQEACG